MSQFLELNEAAKRLGVSPDKLVEMRSNGDIRGFRDGASWKFKEDEIDRAREELADSSGGLENELFSFDEAGSNLDLADDESILVSEEELGHSGEATSSTIIGKATEAAAPDSDLTLAPEPSGSDLTLAGGSGIGGSGIDSELSLSEPDDGGSAVGSDVTLVPGVGGGGVSLVPDPGSDKGMDLGASAGDSDIGDVLGNDSELSLESPGSGGTGNLELSADTGGLGSGDLDMSLDSELALGDDDDMVLSGSGTGSDLSLSAGDSGINLSSPTDSGLSLEVDSGIQLDTPTDSGLSLEEEPLDLGGSSISSLELPEDDEMVDFDDIEAESPSAVKKDEEFLLSPSDEMFMDESDSGSQVIALEDSAAFDQDAATLVSDQALLAETDGLDQQLGALGGGGAPAMPTATPAAAAAQAYAAEPPETPYSIWNILGLLAIIMFLSLSGIVMTDMLKNMWAWEEGGHDVATSISNGLTGAMGLKD
ncbi:MAG: helix-turn-helix domain-containing protein [Planctomycetota bacterium]|nr:helix-turn-helix domain-containing protein [Planctomycetota bacterium]